MTNVDEGEVVNKITSYSVTTRDGGRDVTKNYTFEEPVNGTLKITPREITLTSGSDEKIYNGTPLTKDEVTVSAPGFVDGEGATYTVTGSQTKVGESDNSFTYKLNDNTKASNYTITPEYGKLKVTPVTDEVIVTITENSGSYKYDGTEKTVTGYVVTSISNPLYTTRDFTFSGNATIKGTDAGTYDMNLVPGDFTNTNENFKNVNFVIVNGTLVISPRTLTITSGSDSKEYNGTPLTSSEIKVTGDGFAEGEGATYTVTGSQLDVGSSKNTFDCKLNANTKAKNYKITKEYGDLTVTAVSTQIVITAANDSKVYDGQPLTNGNYTYTGKLAEGDVLTAVVEGSQTDAGSSANVVKSYRVMRGDEDITANYIFDDPVDGTLTVTKRKVTLTSGTACKIYDGEYLTCNKVEVGGDGFVEGEGATCDVTGKRKDIGWSYNDFTYTLNDNTKADNYEITIERGILYVKDQAEKPKTGDSSDLLFLLALMSMSGAGAAGTAYLFRRKREEQE